MRTPRDPVLVLLLLTPGLVAQVAAPSAREAPPSPTVRRDLAYGRDPAHRLDLYLPPGRHRKAPVLAYVHGGGWVRGDKRAVGRKAAWATGRGWILASLNYRLLPAGRHPANVQDLAAALVWLQRKIADHGGDPDRIFAMGHSAGAHLVALVATDRRRLAAAGGRPKLLKGVIALDTKAYDLPTLLRERPAPLYRHVFGTDPAGWRDASPGAHLAAGRGIPPILVAWSRGMGLRADPGRAAAARTFAAALQRAGVAARLVDGSDRTHGAINTRFGDPTDRRVTGAVEAWLDRLAGNGKGGVLRTPPGTPPLEPQMDRHLDIPYARVEGVPARLLSLDLYAPKTVERKKGSKRPVAIMIHGGGWRRGDKRSTGALGAKLHHFVGAGYLYASLNYRLSPSLPRPGGVRHPTHVQDCARALAWLHDNVHRYGGDPGRLHLMGHSAGGHLAALVAVNPRFLGVVGKTPAILRSNVLLDPAALDIPRYLARVRGRGMTRLYALAFGDDPAALRDASPQQHVAAGRGTPPTLIFYAGSRMRLDVLAPAFARALTRAGSPAQAVDTGTLSHAAINRRIGLVGDPMTGLIMRLHAGERADRFPAVLGGEPARRRKSI